MRISEFFTLWGRSTVHLQEDGPVHRLVLSSTEFHVSHGPVLIHAVSIHYRDHTGRDWTYMSPYLPLSPDLLQRLLAENVSLEGFDALG